MPEDQEGGTTLMNTPDLASMVHGMSGTEEPRLSEPPLSEPSVIRTLL